MLLEMLGAEVRTAHDGHTAIELFATSEPSVVLLDIGMPVMDGYEVARVLRERYPERHPTIVAVTGWGQEDDRRRGREVGIDYHLTKPADIDKLASLLAEIAGRNAGERHGITN